MKSMTRIRSLYEQPAQYLGQRVRVGAWIRTLRDQKNFAFVHVNDGSYLKNLQVVFTREQIADYEALRHTGTGAALLIEGLLVETPEAPQPFELHAEHWELEGASPPDYPLQPKRHSPEFLRSIAHLRPRSNLFSAVFRVRSEASFALHEFFHREGFVYVHTPLITSLDAEGAGEMFQVTTLDHGKALPKTAEGQVDYQQDFFGQKAYLTVTGQLNAEAYAQAFGKVYTFGPTFRAEHSNTSRHAAEFWMLEPEIAFAELEEVMALAEAMIKYAVQKVLERCPEEMAFFDRFVSKGLLERLETLLEKDFARMSYTEAVAALEASEQRFEYPVYWGCDLKTEHERYLSEELMKGPVFVTDYPKDNKAFYMKVNADQKTVAACDCLVPGVGEMVGGSQREEDPEVLITRMKESGLNPDSYEWYLALRRYGSTRHGGFGLGFERFIMYLTGINNIRDSIPFPRTVGHASF